MKAELLERIFMCMPTQRKALTAAFTKRPQMESDLEQFLLSYGQFMAQQNISTEQLAEAYLLLLAQALQARIYFMRTGEYPAVSQEQVAALVYDNPEGMIQELMGLALSQFLWPHHYDMLCFYCDQIKSLPPLHNVLEVGSGHGLYTLKFLQQGPAFEHLDIIDISSTALQVTKDIITCLARDALMKIRFLQADGRQFTSAKTYDFITMGEVLEHVADPLEILHNIKRHMHSQSRLFLTTCASSPMPDHLYQFHNVAEIRALLQQAGYRIILEKIAPSVDKELAWLEKNKLDVSYSVMVEVQ